MENASLTRRIGSQNGKDLRRMVKAFEFAIKNVLIRHSKSHRGTWSGPPHADSLVRAADPERIRN